MALQRGVIAESTVFNYLLLFLLFIYLAFDRDLANIYMLMIFADFVWWWTDLFIGNRKVEFPIERTSTNRQQAIIEAVIAVAALLLLTQIIFTLFAKTKNFANAQSIILLYASATPILKGSTILTVFGWGILAPIVETRFFFGRVFEGLAFTYESTTGERINLKKFTFQTILLMAFVAGLFTLFHITAKKLEDIPLLITFIFGMVSLYLVVRDQELKSATLFHIFINTIAVLAALKLLGIG